MNTCGTCGTCKWFGYKAHEGDDRYVPEEYKLCGRIVEDVPPYAAKAIVTDGSGYYAALCVTTDFGCTEWEAK